MFNTFINTQYVTHAAFWYLANSFENAMYIDTLGGKLIIIKYSISISKCSILLIWL